MTTAMKSGLQSSADEILHTAADRENGVPGVVAMATDRNGNVYEGVAGKSDLGTGAPMTLDSVFAIFSTTKAINVSRGDEPL